jgi:hypothetical protein
MAASSLINAILIASCCLLISATRFEGATKSRLRLLSHNSTSDRIVYHPVSASVVTDYEVRSGVRHATVADYVVQGLSNTMHLVSSEYGLRDSESFYWGPGAL